jgi:alpha-beta hydrolase superfamily lysophospholipase
VEGRNIAITAQWADGDPARLPELARALVQLNVDIICTAGTPATLAAKQATTRIRSLQIGADNLSAARIPVEKAQADIILVAGGDDALRPSDGFAKSIEERLASAGKNAPLIQHPDAGHRLLFPSETTLRSIQHAQGGSDEADAELGRSAWDAISALPRQ